MNNEITIRPMTSDDYEEVTALMQGTAGVSMRAADSREAIGRYLTRNPGLSLVAVCGDELIACVFCGHDGRRGYLYHVVVEASRRGKGVGRRLVNHALDGLAAEGIYKTHIDVFADNAEAIDFWLATGWELRDDLVRMSIIRSDDRNA